MNLNKTNNNSGTGIFESTCDPDSVYFQIQVLPLLVSNFSKDGCQNSTSQKEGIVLNNYDNVMTTGDVIPGQPENSKIYEVLHKSDPEEKMPPSPYNSLDNSQIILIFRWIQQGARNNMCLNKCDSSNVTFSEVINLIMQNSCIGCHSGPNASGQIDLTTYQNISLLFRMGDY